MKRSALRLLAASSLLVALLAPAAERPRYGGVLRVQVRDAGDRSAVTRLTHQTLTRVDEHGKPQPLLATTWEAQNGNQRWQFWLRREVRFHDATPLTAAAVVASLTATECENCPWTTVRPVGDSVVFEFASGRPNFAAEVALPRYAIGHGDAGTGPFRVPGQGSRALSAFDDYWGGRPFVDGIEFGADGVDGSQADVVEIAAEQARRVQPQRTRVASSQPADLVAVSVSPRKPALEDARLRQAVALAIDRAAIYNVLLQKQGEVAGSLLPNWLSGYAFLLPRTRELPRAQQLVREVGAVPPLVISTSDPRDAGLQVIAERIALNLRDAGINAQTAPRPDGSDLQVRRLAVTSANPFAAFRAMVDRVTTAPVEDPADFQGLYAADAAVVTQFYLVPLAWVPRSFAVGPRVHDLSVTPDGQLQVERAWLDAGASR